MNRFVILPGLLTVALVLASPALGEEAVSLSDEYHEAATRIIGEALLADHAYDNLGHLCDNIGPRLSGSSQLERAIEWALALMDEQGLENVHSEEVMVPHWVRGEEAAWLTSPTRQRLNILGLGRSVGTPPGGIDAEVVVVGNFDEVDALGEAGVAGKIVLYNVPYEGYGATVRYRGRGASHAARYGAVAALVRSVGPMSFDTPHTGAMRYEEGVAQIPAAAVTIENATMMQRMQDRGHRIACHLEMGAQTLPDVLSHNVVAEWTGSERPEEVVIVGGHFDSWDVGQGAQDDGAGCLIAWEAVHILKRLNLRPRRTVRVVLFTNEENGLMGGRGYLDAHRDELPDIVAAIESDTGSAAADGFRLDIRSRVPDDATDEAKTKGDEWADAQREEALAILEDIGELLAPLDGDSMRASYSGADIGPMVAAGVTGLGLNHDTDPYFEIHHTHADTFEKIDKDELNLNVAMMAVMAYVLADMPGRLGPPAEPAIADDEFPTGR